MRRLCDRRAAAVLVAALPSFLPIYDELRTSYGEELNCEIVFGELALEALAQLAHRRTESEEHHLEALFAALEEVAATPGVDAPAVIGHFLVALGSDGRLGADAYFGTLTATIAASIDLGNHDGEQETAAPVSRAASPRVRPRPKRYSGRAPRRRQRP